MSSIARMPAGNSATVASPTARPQRGGLTNSPPLLLVGLMLLVLTGIGLGIAYAERYPKSHVTNSIGMRFRRVPAGEFLMGAVPGDRFAEADEKPQHRVVLTRDILLGQFEVSQAEYHRVMGTNPSWFQWSGNGADRLAWGTDTDELPVECVSWSDAVEFCRRLSALPAEVAAGRTYRLPTEAEWEHACRAGTTTRFHFGNVFTGVEANMNRFHDRPLGRGAYPPNAFGLYDMHGNVLEWCRDWHSAAYYSHSPTVDPQGPIDPDSDHHVLRGGGWAFRAASGSFRDRIPTKLRGAAHGFRVVCVVSQPRRVP